MRRFIIFLGAFVLAGCGQASDNAPVNQVKAQPRKAAYCFFKDEEMKAWTATRGKDGNITVKGKAHVKDPRYKAVFGAPTITGTSAQLAPSISQNDTGYAALEDWWEISAAIPDSSSIGAVSVRCGDKLVAQLKVPPKG